MAHSPLDTPPSSSDAESRRPAFVRGISRIDDAIYVGERTVVTGALLLMSVTVCLNIYYQFLASQRATWQEIGQGTASWAALWPVPAFMAATIGLAHAALARSPVLGTFPPFVYAGTAAISGVVLGFSVLMLSASSSTVCSLLAAITGGLLVVREIAQPIGARESLIQPSHLARIATATFVGIGLVYFALLVPEGYTWAQKLALFLLLWVAFIGASMATHDNRHLMVDAVRKAVPNRLLPWYNGVSYLIAAAFTLAFLWLAWRYFGLRRADPPIPGEIPDWLKVLSIPVSLALVSLRFLGRSIASVLDGVLAPQTETQAPSPPAPAGGDTP